MSTKTDHSNKPWVSNYPPLAEWLKKVGARCLQQTELAKYDGEVAAYIETWQANGHVFLVEVRGYQNGWDLYFAHPSNSVADTLADAEKRLGLGPPKARSVS